MDSSNRPLVVAGPCSVESLSQLHTVVEALQRLPQLTMVRCGVWKPRTHPGGFEGLGTEALQWMAALKGEYPTVRFCCEVARPEHVEHALHYGIDAVWIGARTTANPFMVQELTEALRGTQTPIMVKNAPSPDIELWMGAMERCWQVGLSDIMAVHRGFEIFHNSGYRNTPLWEVPIELRRRMPDIPILCDPSHISGRKELIAEVSQTALDMGFDGLMIEVHPHPDEALTDARQQIIPEELQGLLAQIVLRKTDTPDTDMQLALLREEIDTLDHQLLQLLAKRFEVSRHIAEVKRKDNIAIFQPQRWEQVLSDRLALAQSIGLSEAFTKGLYEKIHAESIRIQRKGENPQPPTQ